MIKALKHLPQPSSDSCVATCVAMVCGDKEVDLEFHKAHYIVGEKTLISYLLERGVVARRPEYPPSTFPHRLGQGYVFLVQAPSLNYENATHMVVVDYRTAHPQILDPNKGREGVLVYEKFGHGVHDLRNWTVEAVLELA